MPSWLFWIIVWWASWLVIYLMWFTKNRSERINLTVLFFVALICGFAPFLAIFHSIRKAIKKDN